MLVTCHRPKSWPDGAPTQTEARKVAAAIGEKLSDTGAAERLPRPSVIVVTGNRRRQLALKRSGSWYELRLGLALLEAPALVVDSVLEQLRTGRFPEALQEFIRGVEIPQPALPGGEPPKSLAQALERAITLVSERASEAEHVQIQWSRTRTGKRRRSIRLGSATPAGLIRIHPALDSSTVPEYVLDMVVYHELCHCLAPPLTAAKARQAGEHRIHHSKFRALEARYPRLGEANEWVRMHLDSLLRSS